MKLLLILLPFLLMTACVDPEQLERDNKSDTLATAQAPAQVDTTQRPPFKLILHGGAGTIRRGDMTPEMEQEYRNVLEQSLRAGHDALNNGQSALDAVIAAIVVMEDSELFNAGKGAVYTADATHELDASIMDGRDLSAGAIAGVTTIKNPIRLARLVMEQSPHVMLIGPGAEAFARTQGVEMVENSYFNTQRRLDQLRQAQQADQQQAWLDHTPEDQLGLSPNALKFGTVGVVALDRQGNLAAGTSTGGMTNKRWGRVGDAPIIGAGTYANNQSCAVSATGHGEYFIRGTLARDVCALMEYGEKPLQEAADQVIMQKLSQMGGTGGLVAMDRMGNIAMPFNTEGMYRGWIDHEGNVTIEIYGDR